MPLSLLPASAHVARIMQRLASVARLRTPLAFRTTDFRGINVQPSTSTAFLCEATLERLSEHTLEVLAAHEVGHLVEFARLWRYLLHRRAVALTAVATVLAVLGHTSVAECIILAGVLSVHEDTALPKHLADARSEVFADTFACRHVTDVAGWGRAVSEYCDAIQVPTADDVLMYRRAMLDVLSRRQAFDTVLKSGPAALAWFEPEAALTNIGAFARLGITCPAHSAPRHPARADA